MWARANLPGLVLGRQNLAFTWLIITPYLRPAIPPKRSQKSDMSPRSDGSSKRSCVNCNTAHSASLHYRQVRHRWPTKYYIKYMMASCGLRHWGRQRLTTSWPAATQPAPWGQNNYIKASSSSSCSSSLGNPVSQSHGRPFAWTGGDCI